MVSFFKRNASNPEPDDMVEDHHIPGTDIMRDHDGIHVQRGHGGQGEVYVLFIMENCVPQLTISASSPFRVPIPAIR